MQEISTQWAAYPMGPKMRTWLGISAEAYGGDNRPRPDQIERQNFADFLVSYIEEVSTQGTLQADQLADLVDELVAMDLPLMALKLIDQFPDAWHRDQFRGVLAEGIAAMQVGELDRSEKCFRIAQTLVPAEPAPYVNLVQILIHGDRLVEARTWCEAGLMVEPNNLNLWDLMADISCREKESFSHHDIINSAKKYHSWAGYSLAADLDPQANSQTKAGHLDSFYHQGERSAEFLIEYTGALGSAGDFEKIPQIIWQAEKFSSEPLPWKLHLHGAQAHLAMNQLDRFGAVVDRLRRTSGVPPHIIDELDKTYIEESQSQSTGLHH